MLGRELTVAGTSQFNLHSGMCDIKLVVKLLTIVGAQPLELPK